MKQILQKLEWLVIIRDKPNVNRLAFRQQHLSRIPELVKTGIVTNAGAVFADLNRSKFLGSLFNLRADNESEIIEFLKQDIYAKEGIWDFDNVTIMPYMPAYREGKEMK